jgi:hypothetical protein
VEFVAKLYEAPLAYGVPVPSDFVFQPENVYPDLVRVFEVRFAVEDPI